MSNLNSFLLNNLDLLVAIFTIVFGAVWASLRIFGKVYVEEAVKQGFRKEMAQQELINRHKFSLADEQRKAIYDFNEALYNYFGFSIFIKINPKYFTATELPQAISDILNGFIKIGIAAEKLSLLFIDNDEHSAPLGKLNARLIQLQVEALEFLQAYHNEKDIAKAKLLFEEGGKTLINHTQNIQAELPLLRHILSMYLKSISK